MLDRTRPIRKEICLNEQELNLIQHKMRQRGTHNFGAYARKMLIDGYIYQGGLYQAEKVSCRRQQDCYKHQPRLPPHQQHRARLRCRCCRAERTDG